MEYIFPLVMETHLKIYVFKVDFVIISTMKSSNNVKLIRASQEVCSRIILSKSILTLVILSGQITDKIG